MRRLCHGRCFRAGCFNAGRGNRSGLGHGIAMDLRFRIVRLSLALHLQPVLFQLLGVKRLLRTLLALLRVLRPAFATVGTIAPIGAASAAAAAIASRAARLFAILLRLTVAVLRTCTGSLLHRRPLLLLRTRVALIGSPLALRTIGLRAILPAVLAHCLRLLALLRVISLLRPIGLRPILPPLRPVRARLLLLRGPLVAPCIAIAALLLVRPAAAAVALVIAPALATSVTAFAALAFAAIASATATASATFAAAMFVPVARFVAAAVGPLRPCRMHRRFVGCGRLVGGLFRLEQTKQATEESRACGFR